MNREKIEKGEYLFFAGNTTHGGVTYEAPAAGEDTKWYPALHLNLDSKYIRRTVGQLNYDTQESVDCVDYFPKEHHRATDYNHMVQHAYKAMSELNNLAETLVNQAEKGDYLTDARDPEDWDPYLERALEAHMDYSKSLKKMLDKKIPL
jgi:hypothetical protein